MKARTDDSKYRLGSGILGHDGAKIHGVHVLGGACQDLLDYDPVSFLGRVEWIPKRI